MWEPTAKSGFPRQGPGGLRERFRMSVVNGVMEAGGRCGCGVGWRLGGRVELEAGL